MKNGKFRKVIREFDLRDAIEEVNLIQAEQAKMRGVILNSRFKPQKIYQDCKEPISLFNKPINDQSLISDDPEIDIETAESKKQRRFDRIIIGGKLHPEEKLLVKTDKRRL